MRRDIRRVGVVGKWRELAEDRGCWKSIMVEAGQKCGAIGRLINGRGGEEEE